MKKFLIIVNWTLEGVSQTNHIPVFASGETSAHSIARQRIQAIRKNNPGVDRLTIVNSTTAPQ